MLYYKHSYNDGIFLLVSITVMALALSNRSFLVAIGIERAGTDNF